MSWLKIIFIFLPDLRRVREVEIFEFQHISQNYLEESGV
jgi:hypothetical protein